MTISSRNTHYILFLLFLVSMHIANQKFHYFGVYHTDLILHKHQYWRLFTHAYVHNDWGHLIDSMIGVLIFQYLSYKTPSVDAFKLTLVFAFSSGLFFLCLHYPPVVGFSGVGYGMIAFYALQYYFREKKRFYIYVYIAGMIGIVLSMIFEYYQLFGEKNVAHLGHIFLYCFASLLYFTQYFIATDLK